MTSRRINLSLFFALVFAGVGLRLLCRDIPNFAPVAAMALFAGTVFSSVWIAALVPLTVMLITNFYLGGYDDWLVMITVLGCLSFPTVLGNRFLKRDQQSLGTIPATFGLSLAGSLLFFFVTNYASYLAWYPRSWSGLADCFWCALPFFRYTLMGDLFFCGLFFGCHAVAVKFFLNNAKASQPEIVSSF